MNHSAKSPRWALYAVLFLGTVAFCAVFTPFGRRGESAFHYNMSPPPPPGPAAELAASGGTLPPDLEPSGAEAAPVQSEDPPDYSYGGGPITGPDGGAVSPEEAGQAAGAAFPGTGLAGEGGGSYGSGPSGPGPSGNEFPAVAGSDGRNRPSSPGGRKGAAPGRVVRTGEAGGGSLLPMRSGSVPKSGMDALFAITDEQVKKLGKAAQQQVQQLKEARAAEEKSYEDRMEAANDQPFEPPPVGAPPIQRGQVWPVKGGGRVTQEFAPTDWAVYGGFTYKGRYYPHFHKGMDIAAPRGTPLLSLDAGRVTYAGGNQAAGVGVIVQHPGGLATTYWHMGLGGAGPAVRVGEYVGAGQVLGYIGMTGMTTGPHVHFAANKGGALINPREVLPNR